MLILHPDTRRVPAPLAPAHPRSRRAALPQPARAARSYLAGVSRGLDAAGVPHASVTTTDPQQVQAVLDGVTVAGLEDFLWVGSLLETFHLTRRTYPGDARQACPGTRAAWRPGAPHRPCCRAVLRLAGSRGPGAGAGAGSAPGGLGGPGGRALRAGQRGRARAAGRLRVPAGRAEPAARRVAHRSRPGARPAGRAAGGRRGRRAAAAAGHGHALLEVRALGRLQACDCRGLRAGLSAAVACHGTSSAAMGPLRRPASLRPRAWAGRRTRSCGRTSSRCR